MSNPCANIEDAYLIVRFFLRIDLLKSLKVNFFFNYIFAVIVQKRKKLNILKSLEK